MISRLFKGQISFHYWCTHPLRNHILIEFICETTFKRSSLSMMWRNSKFLVTTTYTSEHHHYTCYYNKSRKSFMKFVHCPGRGFSLVLYLLLAHCTAEWPLHNSDSSSHKIPATLLGILAVLFFPGGSQIVGADISSTPRWQQGPPQQQQPATSVTTTPYSCLPAHPQTAIHRHPLPRRRWIECDPSFPQSARRASRKRRRPPVPR